MANGRTLAPVVFGHCRDEQLIRDGVMASDVDPAVMHALCPGATKVGDKIGYCACPHHADEEIRVCEPTNYCQRCGHDTIDRAKRTTFGKVVCIDIDLCNATIEEKRATNPAFAKMMERREQDELRASLLAQAESAAGGNTATRSKTGRCEFSGAPTRGGRFLPGNDAKLKSQLLSQAESGDIDALAEVIYRGWPYKADRYEQLFVQAAMEVARDPNHADDWFQFRLRRRWEAIDNGQ